MRCPACGARNADTAAWCSQCYRSFTPDADQEAARGAQPEAQPGPKAVGEPRDPEAAQGAGSSDPRFRRTGDGVDWRCGSCDTWNPIERSTCSACGTSLAATMGEEGGAETRDVAPATIAVASVLLPGTGHILLGRVAAGIGRMVLYVVWMVGGISLLTAAAGTDGSVLPSMPLLTGALVLLATSVIDAAALRRGDATEVLSMRALLWLTVGVVGLTTLALIGSALSVTG